MFSQFTHLIVNRRLSQVGTRDATRGKLEFVPLKTESNLVSVSGRGSRPSVTTRSPWFLESSLCSITLPSHVRSHLLSCQLCGRTCRQQLLPAPLNLSDRKTGSNLSPEPKHNSGKATQWSTRSHHSGANGVWDVMVGLSAGTGMYRSGPNIFGCRHADGTRCLPRSWP
jgi:hypothetical protein